MKRGEVYQVPGRPVMLLVLSVRWYGETAPLAKVAPIVGGRLLPALPVGVEGEKLEKMVKIK